MYAMTLNCDNWAGAESKTVLSVLSHECFLLFLYWVPYRTINFEYESNCGLPATYVCRIIRQKFHAHLLFGPHSKQLPPLSLLRMYLSFITPLTSRGNLTHLNTFSESRTKRTCSTSPVMRADSRDASLKRKRYNPGDRVVMFDGVCAMCNAGVDIVMKFDKENQFKFAALQSETGKALAHKFGCPSDLSTMVYIEDNQAYIKSDAMLRVGRRLGWAFALPSELALLAVPKPIRDYVYTDLIAKQRYSMFGKRDQCRFVEPGQEHRFLD